MNKQKRNIIFGFIVVIVVILLVFVLYRRFGEPKFPRREQENFEDTPAPANTGINQNLEEDKITSNDLIENGSFELGKDVTQLGEKRGGNTIITLANPGRSSNVLQQTQMNSETNTHYKQTFYMIQVSNLLPNRSYYLQCYVHQSSDWNGKDFLFNVLMQPSSLSYQKAELKSGDGKILEQVKLSNGRAWNLVQFEFRTPEDFNGVIQIYLGYRPENTAGFRYITGIVMRQFLEYAKDYPVSEGLQVFLSGVNCNSYSNNGMTWKDLSDNSNDFNWNVKPKFHAETGQFIMDGYTATGPSGFRLLSPPNSTRDVSNYQNQFTLIMDPTIQTQNSISAAEITLAGSQLKFNQQIAGFISQVANPNNVEITDDDRMVSLFLGNRNIALAIFWPKNNGGKIKLIIADQLYQTVNSINPTNNLLYSFMFTGSNFIIFEGNSIIFNEACNPIYFKTRSVMINPLQTYNGLLRFFIFYNRVLRIAEIMKINEYTRTHDKATETDCIEETRPNISDYMLDVPSNGRKLNCDGVAEKLELINRAVDLRIGNTTVSAEERGRIRKEEEDKVLNSNDRSCIAAGKVGGDLAGIYDTTLGANCPRLFQKNGEFYIKVESGSEIEKIYGRSGNVVLGTTEEKAQKVYEMNHPDCVKKPTTAKPASDNCPFVVQKDYNPCRCPSCEKVDWTKDPLQQFIPDGCKRSVRAYCETHADVEGDVGQACYYWGKGKDLPSARQFRNYFGEMAQCDFNNADISKHPDASKYIRKDVVSSVCTTCPLDSYESAKDPRMGAKMGDTLHRLLNL